MAIDPTIPLPESAPLVEALNRRTRAAENLYLDVAHLADAIFANHMTGNALLLGAAFQAGAIPFTLDAMQEAIRQGRVAVDENLAAFAWGRALAADPTLVHSFEPVAAADHEWDERIEGLLAPFHDEPGLHATMRLLLSDLTSYQDVAHAASFAQRVAKVSSAVDNVLPTAGPAVAEAFAHRLHRLMAYKDEYEVARLLLLAGARDAVTQEFGSDARVSWNLHPPILRTLGVRRKVRLGPWFRPVLVGLRGMRALRGTWADPFGPARMRRLERCLIADYLTCVDQALAVLDDGTAEEVMGIVTSADMIRGYEHVKARNVLAWCDYLDAAMPRIGAVGAGDSPARALASGLLKT